MRASWSAERELCCSWWRKRSLCEWKRSITQLLSFVSKTIALITDLIKDRSCTVIVISPPPPLPVAAVVAAAVVVVAVGGGAVPAAMEEREVREEEAEREAA